MSYNLYWIGLISLLIAAALALLRGGKEVRAAAAFLIGGQLLSTLFVSTSRALGWVTSPPLVDLIASAAIGVALLVLAFRYASWWLGAAILLEGTECGFDAMAFGNTGELSLRFIITALDANGLVISLNLLIGIWFSRQKESAPK